MTSPAAPSSRRGGLLVALALGAATACSAAEPAAPRAVERAPRLEVRTVGAGDDVVVLVHGGPGLSKEAMAPYEALAGDDRRVVSYDQRGAGRSAVPADGDFGLDAQVADLERVRLDAGADRLSLVGQSWGGIVSMAYTAAHPDRVRALVLVGSGPLDLTEFDRGQDRFVQRLTALQAAGLVPDPLPERVEGSCAELDALLPVYAADPAAPPREPAGVTCARRTADETFADALVPARLQQAADGLRSWRGRALAVEGARDPFAWLDVVVAGVPGAERLLVPGAGHLVSLEQPELLLSAIERTLT